MLQCGAVWCSVVQCDAVCVRCDYPVRLACVSSGALQCDAVCCSVMQCDAV